MTAPTWRDTLDDAHDWRVLTVKPPWSWAVAFGGKTIENRSAGWHYRGPLVIHAGAGWSPPGAASPLVRAAWHGDPVDEPITAWGHPPLPSPERHGGLLMPSSYLGPGHDPTRVIWHGCMVAVANLVDVHTAGPCAEPGGPCSPWGETAYTESGGRTVANVTHLVLDDVLGLPNGPHARGRLGLWGLHRWAGDAVDPLLDEIDQVLTHPPTRPERSTTP